MTDARHSIHATIYRHDIHKLYGTPHEHARDTINDVPVNQPVSLGADADAAAMSRPPGDPEPTVASQTTPARLPLLTGGPQGDTLPQHRIDAAVRELLQTDAPDALHRLWLNSDVFGAFNESVYYPYTSLKYHTLLVAALCDNYRVGTEFADLRLVVDPAGEIVPHRTVYTGEHFALHIDADTDGRPAARLGRRPWQSWAATWTRLPAHPLDTAHNKYDMVLDANLRRIGAWSTALQYIEDVQTHRLFASKARNRMTL